MSNFEAPAWFSSLRNQPKLQALGFSFVDDASIEAQNLREEENYFLLASSEDLGQYQCVDLWYSAAMPEKLFVSLGDLFPWLHFPIEPTVEALGKVYEQYISPAKHLPEPIYALDTPSAEELAIRYREAEAIAYTHKKIKRWSLFLGHKQAGSLLSDFEQGMLQNPYLSKTPICLGSFIHDGRYSQSQSLFSCSLYSVRRESAFATQLYFLDIEYWAKPHRAFWQELKEHSELRTELPFLADLPEDFPIDALGAILAAGVRGPKTQEMLLGEIAQGNIESALILSVMLSDADFEQAFLPLAKHPDKKIRSIVEQEAKHRNSETILHALMEADDLED